jgi:hypothetical protein
VIPDYIIFGDEGGNVVGTRRVRSDLMPRASCLEELEEGALSEELL